jgi:hypothetical protein
MHLRLPKAATAEPPSRENVSPIASNEQILTVSCRIGVGTNFFRYDLELEICALAHFFLWVGGGLGLVRGDSINRSDQDTSCLSSSHAFIEHHAPASS